MNVILVFLITLIVFKQKTNRYALLGICLLITGIILILINSDEDNYLDMKLLDKYFK